MVVTGRPAALAISLALFASACGQGPAPEGGLPAPARYAQACHEPRAGWMRPGQDAPGGYPLWHHLEIVAARIEADGSLRWHGQAVSRADLRRYLAAAAKVENRPAVTLRVNAESDCETVEMIRDDMEELLHCAATGLCGEGEGEWQP